MSKTVKAAALHYVIEGDGPWVTLAHSLATELSLFDAQAKLLANRYRVLRIDIRGHGKSEAPAGPYSMGELADDVQVLFQELQINRTAWVGVSLGGMIGLTHTLNYPGVIDRLVVADTTGGYPPEAHGGWHDRIALVREKGASAVAEGTLGRWFTAAFREKNPELMRHFAAIIAATPSAGFVGCCEAIIGYDIKARLGEIKCPTLVMVGDQDQATPPAMGQVLAEGITGATFSLIPSAAHQASVEQPKLFNDLMEKFLASAN
jgi:3-oxoadipate enol-lactonase